MALIDDTGGTQREVFRSGPISRWVGQAIRKLAGAAHLVDAQVARGEPVKVVLNVHGDSVKAEVTQYL